jgi:uncharacterized protein (DUF1697 family)
MSRWRLMPGTRHIVLLRGINVGRHNQLPMPELRQLLSGLGYGDVRTHLRSGNVVLSSDAEPDALERDLEEQIAAEFGFQPRVLVRTRDELAGVVERNPLGHVADDGSRYHVSFLSGEPSPDVVRELSQADVAPEQFAFSGREIYIWLPGGSQRAQALKLLTEKRLGVTATVRNWNTVTKLLELAGA